MSELRRLIVRHRHVGPMVSALLASVDAAVTIRDAEGAVILERDGASSAGAGVGAGAGAGEATVRTEVAVDGDILGWVEGGRASRGVAAVLAYAAARERDKRSLANEALERYRELSLIYDLAAAIGGSSTVEPVVTTAVEELSRLPHAARGFLLLANGDALLAAPGSDRTGCPVTAGRVGAGIVGAVAATGGSELVEDTAADPRATPSERAGASLVAAALRAGDVTIGVVGATATGGPFRSADLKVVTAIAALAGPAIGRALGIGTGARADAGGGTASPGGRAAAAGASSSDAGGGAASPGGGAAPAGATSSGAAADGAAASPGEGGPAGSAT